MHHNKGEFSTNLISFKQLTPTSLLVESFVIGLFCLDKLPAFRSGPELLLREGSAEENPACLPSSSPVAQIIVKKCNGVNNKEKLFLLRDTSKNEHHNPCIESSLFHHEGIEKEKGKGKRKFMHNLFQNKTHASFVNVKDIHIQGAIVENYLAPFQCWIQQGAILSLFQHLGPKTYKQS